MPKKEIKTAPGKSNLNAAEARKAAEFRRRMQAQTGTAPLTPSNGDELKAGTALAALPPTASRLSAPSRGRAAAAPRTGLSYGGPIGRRNAAATLSVEDELVFVRKDIRRLIVLAAIALIILIALSFFL